MFLKQFKKIIIFFSFFVLLQDPAIIHAQLDARGRYQKLAEELNIYNNAYYIEAKPLISDEAFDKLMKELLETERAHPEWITPDSPSQHAGSDIIKGAKIFPHKALMLSIPNTRDFNGLIEFDRKNQRTFHSPMEYNVEEKIDGVAISLEYQNGKLARALTRGDGTHGKDVADIISLLPSVPKQLPKIYPQTLEIRGEIYIPKAMFDRINQQRSLLGQKPFANARNLAAASLSLNDSAKASGRGLEMTAYAVGFSSDPIAATQEELLKILQGFGFKVPIFRKLCHSMDEAASVIKGRLPDIGGLPYEIDGFVVKVNGLARQKALGTTGKDVLGMIAYKFYNAGVQTKVKDIIWQVGRTGKITPVAVLEPVWVDGSLVNRASLSSHKIVNEFDIRAGDTVLIEKSGRVIPKILKVLSHSGASEEKHPAQDISECPVCRLPLSLKNKGALMCENKKCAGRIKKQIEYFTGKNRMDLQGLGPALIGGLVDQEIIKETADLYSLNSGILSRSGLVNETQSRKILQSIEESKLKPLDKLLAGLGINLLGPQKAKILARHFHSLKDLSLASAEDLQKISGIGKRLANGIVDFLKDKENEKLLSIFKN